MGKSHETFGKKERENKRLQKIRDKKEKKEQRQSDPNKAKSFEEMLAYVDENGSISASPPKFPRAKVNAEDISIGVPTQSERQAEAMRTGVVTFFNQAKGFGFIKDQQTQQSIFVHATALLNLVQENDKVVFEVEKGPKGLSAVQVKKA